MEADHANLVTLNGLMLLIHELHHVDDEVVRYRFSEEAQELLEQWDSGAQLAGIEAGYVVEDSDSDDEDVEPIKTPSGTKFVDHVCKFAANMHILYCALTKTRTHSALIKIPGEIPRETVMQAYNLVMYIQRQMEMMLEVSCIYKVTCTCMF